MNASRKPAHHDQDAFFAALGRRIKELRKERGWSLSHMHIRFGYVPSQWQRFEKGSSVTLGSLLRMAEIFDINLVSLISSLGEFPRKRPHAVAEAPPLPKITEKALTKSTSMRRRVNPKPATE
jgi:transcriptional regulator with XRE-family HTH domain